MPHVHGDAFMRAIERHRELAAIPIIVVTAHTDVRMSRTGFALLEKPVHGGDLRDLVRAAAARRPATREALQPA